MITRRGFLGGILAAPAIIKIPGLLMPVKAWHEGVEFKSYEHWEPISGPWALYKVAPGEKISRGGLVTLGSDGYVRPWTGIPS